MNLCGATVRFWLKRFNAHGLQGLEEDMRSGRPPTYTAELAQEHVGGADLGMAFLDGTNIRAHAKAAGAAKKGELARAETSVKRLAGLVAAMAPRPSPSPTLKAGL